MPREEHSDEEGDDLEWNLGFAEAPERATDLLRHRFPSKIGGRPAWLDPVHLPSRAQLTCGASGEPLRFLLQVYSPLDGNPAAFHRAVYVFVSPRGDKLSSPGAARALRCQLARENPYYAPVPAGPRDLAPPKLQDADAAAAAAADPWGAYAAEQAAVRPAGGGGGAAATGGGGGGAAAAGGGGGEAAGAGAGGGPRLFKEFELVVDAEPEDDGENSPEVQRVLASYRERVGAEGEYDDNELPPDVMDAFEDEGRAAFAMFQARCARAPDQCLRYCFEPGAAPLWPSKARRPKPGDIPDCLGCGRPRRFEFQVMPQLINFLGEDDEDPHAQDWGTIAVYSCPASCGGGAEGGGSAYVEEFVWVQPTH